MVKKGSFGYLRRAGKISLIKSAAMLAAVLIVYFTARWYFHTNKNVFTLLAAAGALPTGRSIVMSIMLLRAVGASEQVHKVIETISGLPADCSGYDLYLTAYERSYSISHAAVVGGIVAGLTEDKNTDCRLCEQHLREMLKKDSHNGYEVHIYNDTDQYVKALTEMCAAEPVPEDRAVMQMIYGISI